MTSSIRDVIANTSDDDLLEEMWSRIIGYHDPIKDPSKLPEASRTMLMVYHTMGIIGNGGFRYLFEGNLPGDPHYQMALEAYRQIGCEESVAAFESSFALFPDDLPPTDPDERLDIYLENVDGSPSSEDEQFWDAKKTRMTKLLEYIRAHVEDFAYLDEEPPPRPPEEDEEDEFDDDDDGDEDEDVGPTMEQVLSELPRWAQVMFAVRCGWYALELLPKYWPDAPEDRLEELEKALDLVEKCATTATPDEEGLKRGVMKGMMMAGTAQVESNKPGGPANVKLGTLASFCAKAIESAAEAARPDSYQSCLDSTMDAFIYLMKASDEDEDIYKAVDRDLEVLLDLSEENDWDEDTPVTKDLW